MTANDHPHTRSRNRDGDENAASAAAARPIRSADEEGYGGRVDLDDDDDGGDEVVDDDASRRPLISPRDTSSSANTAGVAATAAATHPPTTAADRASATASRAWETIVATFHVYRAELSKRIGRPSETQRGKQKQRRQRGISTQGSTATSTSPPPPRLSPLLRSILITLGGLIALLLVLIAIASIHLFTSTLSTPSPAAQSRILDEAIVVRGPDSLELLNISDAGIQVRITGRMGLDPDTALDIWLDRKSQESWWKRKDRQVVEWALRKVGGVRIEMGTLSIEEPDWRLHLDERELDLLPHDNKTGKAVSTASPLPSPPPPPSPSSLLPPGHPPRPLLSFNLDPLYIPLPALLSSSEVAEGDNATRRAHLTMQPLNLTLLFKPASPAPYIVSVVEDFIARGNATLDVRMASLAVRGLTHKEMRNRASTSSGSWMSVPSWISLSQSQVINRIRQAIPDIKPPSDDDQPFLNLTRYDFFEIKSRSANRNNDTAHAAGGSLGIKAFAEALNPLGPILKGSVKYRVPFGIYLPVGDDGSSNAAAAVGKKNTTHPQPIATTLLAAVASEPFKLNGQDKIDLVVKGRVVPPSSSPSAAAAAAQEAAQRSSQHPFSAAAGDVASLESPQEAALSAFLSRFLRGEPNTVYVRGGSPFAPNDTTALDPFLPGTGSPDLPAWMTSALSVVDLPISFPGSKVTDLIRNVTLSNLSIKPHPFSDEKLLFSATIRGVMALPGQLKAVDVKIQELWPDILVFDGAPPNNGGDGDGDDGGGGLPDDGGDDDDDDDDDDSDGWAATAPEPIPPPPSPLPHGAFGRVRPRTWVPATTYMNVTDGTKHLESNLTDVPFTILPGRAKEFRSFTWKLITAGSEGVLTGIQGASRVHIWNSGLGSLEISKLPVEGAFVVGGSKESV